MAVYEHRFELQASPDQVWSCLSDLNRLHEVFSVEDPELKCWGDRFVGIGGWGVGTELDMFLGQKLARRWRVDHWDYAQRMKISSDFCVGDPLMHTKSSLEITLAYGAEGRTAVTARLEAVFTWPLTSFVLNRFPPFQRRVADELGTILLRMEERLRAKLQGA